MRVAVVDSNIAIKWVIDEPDSDEALSLRGRFRFIAPDLLVPECANTLWKMVSRSYISTEAAEVAIAAMSRDRIELVPTRELLLDAFRLSVAIDHPAYDCIFAALAMREKCALVSADTKFTRKLIGRSIEVMSLRDAAQA
jgi:predicted nucleic acid-binding protein